MTNTRRGELAAFLEEAHLRVSDGSRPIRTDDARLLADELLWGDGSPAWIAHIEPHAESAAVILAQHTRMDWVEDAVADGPAGTGGWVCECGVVVSDVDLSVPGVAGVTAGAMWLARHQVKMLSMRGAL